jgi:hypothetical protein
MKEKLYKLADYLNVSIRSFESRSGLQRGNISNMAPDGAIGSDKLSKICAAFPLINLEWLLTGEGDMLKPRIVDRMVLYIHSKNDDVEVVGNKLWGNKKDPFSKMLGLKTFFTYYKDNPQEDADINAVKFFMKHYAFDVNPTWLFTGKGSMLKTEEDKKCANCEEKDKEIKKLNEEIGALKFQLSALKKKK